MTLNHRYLTHVCVGGSNVQVDDTGSLDWLALAIVYGIWGTNFAAVSIAVTQLSPFVVTGVQFTAAGAVLYAVARIQRRKPPTAAMRRWSALAGFLLFGGGYGLLALGLRTIASGTAAVILGSIPLWLVLIEIIIEKTRPTGRTIVSLLTGFLGIVIVANHNAADPISPYGVVLLLGAALSWATGSHVARRTPNAAVDNTTHAAIQMLTGGAVLVSISILGAAIGVEPIGTPTPDTLLAMIWLIGPCSIIAITAYNHILHRLPMPLIAGYPYANTTIAVILGWLLLHETITPRLVTGGTITLLAAASLATSPTRTPPGLDTSD